MSFNSVVFVYIFLPVVLAVHTLLHRHIRLQNWWLMLASFLFYGWCNTRILAFLLVFGLVNYWLGLLLEACPKKEAKYLVLIPGVAANVLCLYGIKYLNFSIDLTNRLLHTALPAVEGLLMPLGISFLVFTAISYLVDIYRGGKPLHDVVDFYLYLSFFPKVSQGPITRSEEMSRELAGRSVDLDSFAPGARRFVAGLAKKVLLADVLGKTVDLIFQNLASGVDAGTAWLGLLCYTMQIFFDFSGYTDMAIGIGQMLGFRLPENFRAPYRSKSVSEFWRRWHMTLGSWFRNYVYIPLGGNRCSTLRVIGNLSVVWLLTGLWHGASIHYISWGVYFGCFVILEKLVNKKNWYQRIPGALKWLGTFLIVMLGWVIFRSGGMQQVGQYFAAMLGAFGSETVPFRLGYYFNAMTWAALAAAVAITFMPRWMTAWQEKRPGLAIVLQNLGTIVLFALTLLFMVNSTYSAFIYFQF